MKYDHQAFQVSDIDRSIDFYVNKLGFRLCSKETDNNENEIFAFLEIGDARIELLQDLENPYDIPSIKKPYCPHFSIGVEDLKQAEAMLRANNVNIVRGPLEIKGEVTWLYFSDPDNNIMEFVQWYRKR